MKYIGGKVYDNDGTEMPIYRLNQIVKVSQEYADEVRKNKEKSKEYVKKHKENVKNGNWKEKKLPKRELSADEITSKLSKNLNFKVIKK